MKKVALLAIALLASAFFSAPAAAVISGYSIEAEISDSTVTYRTEMNFTKPVSNIIISIAGSPQNVQVNPSCRIDKALLQTNVICESSLSRIELSYTSTERISHKNNWLVWSDAFKLPEPADNMMIRVRLPAGAALKEPILDAMEPKDSAITSDGRHILIAWEEKDVRNQFSGSIAYENLEIGSMLPMILAVIAIVAVVGFIAYRFYFSSPKEGMKMILPILKKDEKSVLEGLVKHGSGVNQKIIVKESGYSKAKVSKVLKSLNERGLVRLERTGRSNRIFWGKEVKKES